MKKLPLLVIGALTVASCIAGATYIWVTDTCVTDTCRERKQMEFEAISETKWVRAKSDFRSQLDFQLNLLGDIHDKSEVKYNELQSIYSYEVSTLFSEYNMGTSSDYMPPVYHAAVRKEEKNELAFTNIKENHESLSELIKYSISEIESFDVRIQKNAAQSAKSKIDEVGQKFMNLIEIYKNSKLVDQSYIDKRLSVFNNYTQKSKNSYDDYQKHISSK